MKSFSPSFKIGLWTALYEFLIITMPIGIYVILEVLHKDQWDILYQSPEWSIATIFLAFISLSRYRSSLEKVRKPIIEPIFGIISILTLTEIIAATINVNLSLVHEDDHPHNGIIAFRIVLFIIVSLQFILLVTGSKRLLESKHHQPPHP